MLLRVLATSIPAVAAQDMICMGHEPLKLCARHSRSLIFFFLQGIACKKSVIYRIRLIVGESTKAV